MMAECGSWGTRELELRWLQAAASLDRSARLYRDDGDPQAAEECEAAALDYRIALEQLDCHGRRTIACDGGEHALCGGYLAPLADDCATRCACLCHGVTRPPANTRQPNREGTQG